MHFGIDPSGLSDESYMNFDSISVPQPQPQPVKPKVPVGTVKVTTKTVVLDLGCTAKCGQKTHAEWSLEDEFGEWEWFTYYDPDGNGDTQLFNISDSQKCKVECDLSGCGEGDGLLIKKGAVVIVTEWKYSKSFWGNFYWKKTGPSTVTCGAKTVVDTSENCY